jgi:hypothetical protein
MCHGHRRALWSRGAHPGPCDRAAAMLELHLEHVEVQHNRPQIASHWTPSMTLKPMSGRTCKCNQPRLRVLVIK